MKFYEVNILINFFFFQCVKSKSVTNLAEATADPALELDAGGNPINQSAGEPQGREDLNAGGINNLIINPDQPPPDDQH